MNNELEDFKISAGKTISDLLFKISNKSSLQEINNIEIRFKVLYHELINRGIIELKTTHHASLEAWLLTIMDGDGFDDEKCEILFNSFDAYFKEKREEAMISSNLAYKSIMTSKLHYIISAYRTGYGEDDFSYKLKDSRYLKSNEKINELLTSFINAFTYIKIIKGIKRKEKS